MSMKDILIITAVEAEKNAVLAGLKGDTRFKVLAGGVGPVAVGISTAKALTEQPYDLVISAGIGGGFSGKAEVGSLVLAEEIIIADLGVETSEGFLSVDELGFGTSRVQADLELTKAIEAAINKASLTESTLTDNKLTVSIGSILTVSTVTGTAEGAERLLNRVPGAVAEAMEGYGVALAAKEQGIPVLELRAISNAVGPRDRAAWRIKEALEALTSASKILSEVL